ncbi:hypothetical protein JG688_00013121 [Phytophthora aleatoria]|uniref:Tc1-like transposase DDE domain-containing protein n=1 Tax=Phytophthora aleatoria TaxID=2496075 RepID=A0A8J5IJL0_9STRA|nr:hypothetical protein JG688_00013121 [Phytophthora aleatoria]
MREEKVAIRGDFQCKPPGMFDRVSFVECCRDFVYSNCGNIRQYPGSNSVWILDGAKIHRQPEIVHYLHSVGVVPMFLPAYCPFFNPIEFMLKLSSATTASRVRGISHHLSWKHFSGSRCLIWHVCLSIADGRRKATSILLGHSRRRRERCQTFGKTREEFCKDDYDLEFSTQR